MHGQSPMNVTFSRDYVAEIIGYNNWYCGPGSINRATNWSTKTSDNTISRFVLCRFSQKMNKRICFSILKSIDCWELDVIGKIEYIVALLPFYAHIHFTISVDKQWNLKQLHIRAFLHKEINKFV